MAPSFESGTITRPPLPPTRRRSPEEQQRCASAAGRPARQRPRGPRSLPLRPDRLQQRCKQRRRRDFPFRGGAAISPTTIRALSELVQRDNAHTGELRARNALQSSRAGSGGGLRLLLGAPRASPRTTVVGAAEPSMSPIRDETTGRKHKAEPRPRSLVPRTLGFTRRSGVWDDWVDGLHDSTWLSAGPEPLGGSLVVRTHVCSRASSRRVGLGRGEPATWRAIDWGFR